MSNETITLKVSLQPTCVRLGDLVEVAVASSLSPAEIKRRNLTLTLDHGGQGSLHKDRTGTRGCWDTTNLGPGVYPVTARLTDGKCTVVESAARLTIIPELVLEVKRTTTNQPDCLAPGDCAELTAEVRTAASASQPSAVYGAAELARLGLNVRWTPTNRGTVSRVGGDPTRIRLGTASARTGLISVTAELIDATGRVVSGATDEPLADTEDFEVVGTDAGTGSTKTVSLARSASTPTADQPLWVAIRNRTRAIAFSGSGYKDFMDRVLCAEDPRTNGDALLKRQATELRSDIYGVAAYELLKTATEVFLLLNCGVAIDTTTLPENADLFDQDAEAARLGQDLSLTDLQTKLNAYLGEGRLPYINRVLDAAFSDETLIDRAHCTGVLASRVQKPCLIELIWSYWHEEAMLAQSMGAICLRFQNKAILPGRDPLAHVELDPLRPLNNLLWGYVQDEHRRLTLARRAYEYDHHYGLKLFGKAVPSLQSVDSRSKFLEGYHNLLHLCAVFFKQDDDMTVVSDGFPVLNALKEVHLLLAQGAHNQFGDLPWTARSEMLIQQWLLARPEMRDFLQSRAMVPYKEDWMSQVDTMKRLQGWTDISVTHFHDLAAFGEQLLLSIRYGDWINVSDAESAKNWARYWRSELQGYMHAYRAVTGVDLTSDRVDSTMPSIHLVRRLESQRRGQGQGNSTDRLSPAPEPAAPGRNGSPRNGSRNGSGSEAGRLRRDPVTTNQAPE